METERMDTKKLCAHHVWIRITTRIAILRIILFTSAVMSTTASQRGAKSRVSASFCALLQTSRLEDLGLRVKPQLSQVYTRLSRIAFLIISSTYTILQLLMFLALNYPILTFALLGGRQPLHASNLPLALKRSDSQIRLLHTSVVGHSDVLGAGVHGERREEVEHGTARKSVNPVEWLIRVYLRTTRQGFPQRVISKSETGNIGRLL